MTEKQDTQRKLGWSEGFTEGYRNGCNDVVDIFSRRLEQYKSDGILLEEAYQMLNESVESLRSLYTSISQIDKSY